jgi:cytochrome P450
MMLVTLLDFPVEERNRLTYWSDVAMMNMNEPGALVKSQQERFNVLREMSDYVGQLFSERRKLPPGSNLLSMRAHGASTQDMQPSEFMRTLVLLIVGGNDTTRNSMTGGLLALAEHPNEYRKLQQNHFLVHSLVPELIRYVTPVIHMRCTAVKDVAFGAKQIRAGDKVVMWHISGNRDPDAIERPNEFIIDRERPRQHLAFGCGIHRYLGSGLRTCSSAFFERKLWTVFR